MKEEGVGGPRRLLSLHLAAVHRECVLALNAPTNPYLSCGDANPLLSILLLPRGLVGSDGGWVGVGGGRDPLKSERKGRSVSQVDPFSSVRAYAPISGVGKNGRGVGGL